MRKIIIPIVLLLIGSGGISQSIPYGVSVDTIAMQFPCVWDDTCGLKYQTYYYKPATYDSLTSPVILFIHGSGGTGYEGPQYLSGIADRRNALIVAPTTSASANAFWAIGIDNIYESDPNNPTCPSCRQIIWLPLIIKEIYRHVLERELRDSIPVYFTGFSSGGQAVSRYMLIRQAIQDSVPIVMAVSANPYYYTFPTDLLNGITMPFACGLDNGPGYWAPNDICVPNSYTQKKILTLDFVCEKNITTYYEENYGVLIGTADTIGANSSVPCIQAQGANRYERAQNFFNFSSQDADMRGEPFNWKYVEIEGAGHGTIPMYHTKANPDDSSTIAETLLFDTPYQPPAYFSPEADFSYYFLDTVNAVIECTPTPYQIGDTSCHLVSFIPHCFQNKIPSTLYWDFGDGTTSTDFFPGHQYANSGIYNVMLIVSDGIEKDTMQKLVIIDSLTLITANGPTVFCDGDSVLLTVNPAISCLWSTGDTTNEIYVFETDFYSVTTTNGCKSASDSILVWAKANPPEPAISQNGDTLISDPANTYQWYLDGSLLSNDTGQSITVTQSGYYQVEVFHVNGCSAISDSVHVMKTGEEVVKPEDLKIRVYPNPNNGTFKLHISGSELLGRKLDLKIYSVLGEEIYSAETIIPPDNSGSCLTLNIGLSRESTGIYFLTAICNGNVFPVKLIVQ